jgi:FAD/FMN-containing dehydrogenase
LVLEATVTLVDSPPARSVLVLGFNDIFAAADCVPDILRYKPIGLEGIDDVLVEDMSRKGIHPKDVKLLPDGHGWLAVEFGGQSKEEADAHAQSLMDGLKKGQSPPTRRPAVARERSP